MGVDRNPPAGFLGVHGAIGLMGELIECWGGCHRLKVPPPFFMPPRPVPMVGKAGGELGLGALGWFWFWCSLACQHCHCWGRVWPSWMIKNPRKFQRPSLLNPPVVRLLASADPRSSLHRCRRAARPKLRASEGCFLQGLGVSRFP